VSTIVPRLYTLNVAFFISLCVHLSASGIAAQAQASSAVTSTASTVFSGASSTASSTASAAPKMSAPKFTLPKPVPLKRRLFLHSNDFQTWTPVYIFARQGRLREMIEVNPRIGLATQHIDQLILRPAAGLQITRSLPFAVSLWQGYAHVGSWLPRYVVENRSFQQLLVESRFKQWGMLNRTRMEERFIEHVPDTALRMRHLIRVQLPIKHESKWAWVGQEEIFINLNKVSAAVTPGISQNRVFLGVSRQLHPKLNMDVGYQYQWIQRNPPVPDRHNHVLLINTYYTI
jgi:hypothetical protein